MSKGLESLQELEKELSNYYGTDIAYYSDTLEKFNNIARELEALEIIKPLVYLTKEKNYCWLWLGLNGRQITQEQYDLLKEVLK